MEIVLNTFGTALSCENDGLVVKTDRGKKRLPQYGVSSILIGPGVSVTSNAVLHAIEREIELHFVTRGGDMKGLVWSHKYGSISTIRKGQLAFVQSVDAVEKSIFMADTPAEVWFCIARRSLVHIIVKIVIHDN